MNEGSPLQSPSNPDIEQGQDIQDILPENNNESTDNIINNEDMMNDIDKDNVDNTFNADNDNDNDIDNDDDGDNEENKENEEIEDTEDIEDIEDIDDIEKIPNHQRENVISTTKIIPILKEIEKEEQNKGDNDNEEKVNTTNTQKQKQYELKIEHGHCSKQGIRPTMEDQVVVESTFNVFGSKCSSGYMSLYGVFDGHGGAECAEFCALWLVRTLKKYLLSTDNVSAAFNLTISELDKKVIEFAKDASGSTCCILLIDNKTHDLWCCNVGDSRCILINNNYTKVKQLSIEHKPDYPLEKQRIESANGWVTFGRVCGILAVSRSLGDKDFKYEIENLIISTPDITHHKLVLDEDKYIVLACDGLYDVFSNQQCMEWLNNNNNSESMQSITDKLCHDAIYVRKSKDNVSILIIKIDCNEVEIEENDINDFEGQEAMIMDEIKDEKIYNSTSSNGSGGSAVLSQNDENINDSLQSIGSNQSQTDNTENNTHNNDQHIITKKHKFHVVMASDDNINNENQQQHDVDDIEAK